MDYKLNESKMNIIISHAIKMKLLTTILIHMFIISMKESNKGDIYFLNNYLNMERKMQMSNYL
jgi:hypothetical protein